MARTEAKLPGGARLADYLTVGYLALNCPLGQIKEALAACGVQTLKRRDMPRELLVYFVMAMCLYPRVAYEEVLRLVIEGLRRIYGDEVSEAQVSKAAISQGRARLGWEVMRELFERQVAARPVPQQERYAGYRVMSIDGSTLDVPDEQANAQAFGYAQGGRGEAAHPQIRFVAWGVGATTALCPRQMGGLCDSEQALTRQLFPAFSAGVLVVADRLFYCYEMWRDAVGTGAKLLWRGKSNLRLPYEEPLADGSYLSTVYANDSDRRRPRNRIRGGVL